MTTHLPWFLCGMCVMLVIHMALHIRENRKRVKALSAIAVEEEFWSKLIRECRAEMKAAYTVGDMKEFTKQRRRHDVLHYRYHKEIEERMKR